MRRSRQNLGTILKNGLETILVIDYSNLLHRTINSAVKDDKYCENNYNLWKSYMLIGKHGHDGLFGMILKHRPDRVVIALDEKVSWRKEVYPDYKAHRAAQRRKSLVNYEEFFPVADKFLEDIMEVFKNMIFLKVPRCEADDVIAVITKYIHTENKVIIASNDKDFYQLHSLRNCIQYDPLNKEFKNCPNPEMALRIKIILGDRNDGVPGIKFRVGIKTAEDILKEGLDEFLDSEDDLRDKYIMNRLLIDFNYIPDDIVESIKTAYSQIKVEQIDSRHFFNFFIKNKLVGIATDFGIYSKYIEKLN